MSSFRRAAHQRMWGRANAQRIEAAPDHPVTGILTYARLFD